MDQRQLSFAFAQHTVRFLLFSYWREAAKKEGYRTVEAAIKGIYRETGSLRETARRMTFSHETIRQKLIAMGEPLNAPGGPNHHYGRTKKEARV